MAALFVNKLLAPSKLYYWNGTFTKMSKRSYSIQPPNWLGGRSAIDYTSRFEFPEHSMTIEERMKKVAEEERKMKQIEIYTPKNIGTEVSLNKKSSEIDMNKVISANRSNRELEKASRLQTLTVPLDEIKMDWMSENGPNHMKLMAEHYGIFKDLFGGDYFYPIVNLGVYYNFDEDFLTPVCSGNFINPSEATKAPLVEIDSQPDQLWTLLMVNPDENLTNQDEEYVHWLVTNIPGGDISKGEVLIDYFQPISPAGTGYHRNVFLLFEQKGKMGFEDVKRIKADSKLEDRHFKTQNFFKSHESELMPKGLAFFQSQWDESVRNYFRNVLDMPEPSFEYIHPVAYHPPAKSFPHKEPFNLYFDRYRDRKDIDEEVLRIKLKESSPFEMSKPAFKYTMHHYTKKYKPSWLEQKEHLMLRRVEQYKNLN